VRYCLNIVAATVTLGVSQPSPQTENSTRDLEGEAVLIGTMNSRTFPHYGNTKSIWCHGFTTEFESRGAHECKKQWYARDMRA
jgi:hypothetical protein